MKRKVSAYAAVGYDASVSTKARKATMHAKDETTNNQTILIADDEPDIAQMLDEYFTSMGYRTLVALNGREALRRAEQNPSLVLLDVGMPELDGYEVCKKLRKHLDCPIIFLTARVEALDELEGFEAGADDYVIKPFSLHTLGARVKAHLSRETRKQRKVAVCFDGNTVINYSERCVTTQGITLDLTKREFDIVAFLSKHPGQVFDRDRIHEQVGGWEDGGDSSVITEHVRRIRKKFHDSGSTHDHIETVWGMGYRWHS